MIRDGKYIDYNLSNASVYENIFYIIMTLIKRLSYFFDVEGVKKTNLEKELGISNGYLGKMISRDASIGSDVLEKIVYHFPKLNANWLLRGDEDMYLGHIRKNDQIKNSCSECELRERLLEAKEETIQTLKDRIKDLTK